MVNNRLGLSAGRSRTWNRRTTTGAQRLPGQVQQVQRAADAQRIVGKGYAITRAVMPNAAQNM
jgi:hypothetical protein